MAASYIPDLIDADIASLKIEGRMKSPYYLATVVRAYRMLIDAVYEQSLDDEKMKMILDELQEVKTGRRPTVSMKACQRHLTSCMVSMERV